MVGDDIRDFGIEVRDARQLDRCYRELCDAFIARPLAPQDARFLEYCRSIDFVNDAAAQHRNDCSDIAEACLRSSIRDAALTVWIKLETTEEKASPRALGELSCRSIRAGVFIPDNYPIQYLHNRPLWVKNVDWQTFFDGVMAERYAAVNIPPPTAEQAQPLREFSDPEIVNIAHEVHAEGFKGRANTKEVCRRTGATDSAVKLLTKGIFPRTGRRGSNK